MSQAKRSTSPKLPRLPLPVLEAEWSPLTGLLQLSVETLSSPPMAGWNNPAPPPKAPVPKTPAEYAPPVAAAPPCPPPVTAPSRCSATCSAVYVPKKVPRRCDVLDVLVASLPPATPSPPPRSFLCCAARPAPPKSPAPLGTALPLPAPYAVGAEAAGGGRGSPARFCSLPCNACLDKACSVVRHRGQAADVSESTGSQQRRASAARLVLSPSHCIVLSCLVGLAVSLLWTFRGWDVQLLLAVDDQLRHHVLVPLPYARQPSLRCKASASIRHETMQTPLLARTATQHRHVGSRGGAPLPFTAGNSTQCNAMQLRRVSRQPRRHAAVRDACNGHACLAAGGPRGRRRTARSPRAASGPPKPANPQRERVNDSVREYRERVPQQ